MEGVGSPSHTNGVYVDVWIMEWGIIRGKQVFIMGWRVGVINRVGWQGEYIVRDIFPMRAPVGVIKHPTGGELL